MRIASACLVGCLLAPPCAAATVELTLREREGPPVRGQSVAVHPPLPAGDWFAMYAPGFRREGVTGVDGKVVFEGLAPGSYTATLDDIVNPSLIDPDENPYAPAPAFTLAKDSDRVAITIELWRGVPFSAQLVVDHGPLPPAKVILSSLDGLDRKEFRLDVAGKWDGLIVPGRWQAQFEFPAGYLLQDLVSNRESLPGFVARLDVTDDARLWTLTASLAARSRIIGRISSDDGSCPVTIIATLVAPASDWLAAAVARGGSEYQSVRDQFRDVCSYELWLPEGTWIVRPVGDSIVASEPAQVDVAIGLGETRTVDFFLRMKDGKGGQPLNVAVVSPEHKRITGAVVEIYRSDATGDDAEPLATGKTEGFSDVASFSGLPKGAYRAVAGHADYLEAEEPVRDFDPGAKEPTSVTVVLKEGASVRAHASDEKGVSVREVELRLERLGELPKSRLASKEIRDSKRSRAALTDATGYITMKGLPAGEYRFAGRMVGELSGTRFVRVRDGTQPPKEALDATLTEGATLELELAVLPAASLSGSLGCSDLGTLPPEASFRVFDALAQPDPWKDHELREGSLLAAESVKLGGRTLDRFRLGPLEPGTFLVAIRPAGDDYWSWPPALLMPETANAIHLEAKSIFDAGFLELECGPVIALVPKIASGEPTPDLRDGSLEVKTSLANATDRGDDRYFVVGLPEGKVRLGFRVRHPYLIPSEREIAPADFELQRGKLVRIDLPFDAVGGLIEVRGESAVRRTSRDQKVLIQSAVDGRALFPGTPPGTYRIELCVDPECKTIRKAWDAVEVTAARTVTLQ